jgi:hypothetical protein
MTPVLLFEHPGQAGSTTLSEIEKALRLAEPFDSTLMSLQLSQR